MDLGFLKAVYDSPGPYASVYLGTDRAAPEAVHMIDLRWRELRGQLGTQGADNATLQSLDAAVGSDRGKPSPHGQVLFAADGAVLLHEDLQAPTVVDRATFGGLPDVQPFLAQRSELSCFVLVIVDRRGADLEAHSPGGLEAYDQVTGEDWPITKVHTGDLNEARYQRAAENTWESNAKLEAERVRRFAEAHHADMIAVCGDARARTLLLSRLGPAWQPRAFALAGGGRAEGADRAHARRAAFAAAAAFEESGRAAVRERFESGLADGRSVQGLAPTVEALRRGEVDTLLLRYGAEENDAQVWWGPEAGQLTLHAEELAAVHPPWTRRDRAADTLVRAAAQIGGRLLVVADGEPGPGRGVGAVLRRG